MKKIAFALVAVVLLAGGMVRLWRLRLLMPRVTRSAPAGGYLCAALGGPDTPWVYYNGDWFIERRPVLLLRTRIRMGALLCLCPHAILSDPRPGTLPDGSPGTRGIPFTGRTSCTTIPTGGGTGGAALHRSFYEKHNRGHGGEWQKGFHGAHPGAQHPKGVRPGAVPPRGNTIYSPSTRSHNTVISRT